MRYQQTLINLFANKLIIDTKLKLCTSDTRLEQLWTLDVSFEHKSSNKDNKNCKMFSSLKQTNKSRNFGKISILKTLYFIAFCY